MLPLFTGNSKKTENMSHRTGTTKTSNKIFYLFNLYSIFLNSRYLIFKLNIVNFKYKTFELYLIFEDINYKVHYVNCIWCLTNLFESIGIWSIFDIWTFTYIRTLLQDYVILICLWYTIHMHDGCVTGLQQCDCVQQGILLLCYIGADYSTARLRCQVQRSQLFTLRHRPDNSQFDKVQRRVIERWVSAYTCGYLVYSRLGCWIDKW